MRVYLAAPWFTPDQLQTLNTIETALAQVKSIEVFSPRHEGGTISPNADAIERRRIFDSNVQGMESAHLAFAVMYKDSGVAWELGYLFRATVPIVGVVPEALDGKINVMLANTFVDLVTEDIFREWDSDRLERRIKAWGELVPGTYVVTGRDVQ